MASKAIGFLNFKFGADLKGFERAMNKAQKKLKKFGKNVTKAGQNLSRNLTLPILALGAASIKAFDEQAKAEQKLLTSLKGREDIQQRLIEQAKELQKTTLFGDEATIAAQSMLAMMGLTEREIMQLIPLIQDFATAKGMDLVTAADLVAKSMGSSTNALSRYGIEITGAVGSNERLNTAVTQLTQKFKGQAKAAALVGAGPLVQIANQLGDIAEELGQRLMPYVTKFVGYLKTLIKKFDDLTGTQKDNIVKWGLILAAIGPVLIIIGKVATGLAAVIGLFQSLAVFAMANPFGVLIVAIAAIVGGLDMWIESQTRALSQAEALEKVEKRTNEIIKVQEQRVKDLTTKLQQENLSLEDKEKLLNELKTISPEYYGTLDASKLSVEKLTLATRGYITSLKAKAKIEATNALITENEIKLEAEALRLASLKKSKETSLTPHTVQGVIDVVEDDIAGMIETISTYEKIVDDAFKEMEESTASFNEELENLGKNTKKVVKGEGEIVTVTEDYSRALDPLLAQIKDYAATMTVWGASMYLVETWTLKLTKAQEAHNATIQLMEDIMFNAAMSAANSQEKFFKSFIENIKQAIKQLLIQLAVLTVIALLLGGPTMSIGKAFGIAKGKILGLEDGGLVYGPTTALIGEGVGTTASNPEVVAPLDKLKQHMGGGNQNIIVEGVLKGNDIYLSNRNTSVNRLRTT